MLKDQYSENFITASAFQMCAIVSDKLITLGVKLVQISTLLAGVSFGYMLIKCYVSMLYCFFMRLCESVKTTFYTGLLTSLKLTNMLIVN